MAQGGREEAIVEHGIEAIKERRAYRSKSCHVKFVREAVRTRSFGGCSSLHSLLKFPKGERQL
jgi:hypothetical protein